MPRKSVRVVTGKLMADDYRAIAETVGHLEKNLAAMKNDLEYRHLGRAVGHAMKMVENTAGLLALIMSALALRRVRISQSIPTEKPPRFSVP